MPLAFLGAPLPCKVSGNRLAELPCDPETLVDLRADRNALRGAVSALPPALELLSLEENEIAELPDLPCKLQVPQGAPNPGRGWLLQSGCFGCRWLGTACWKVRARTATSTNNR